MKDVAGKVALITGGGSGIGLGIARALSHAGARVVLADLRADHLAEASETLGAEGHTCHCVEVDVTDRPAVTAAAERVTREIGPVQILVNNAGIGIEGPFAEVTFDDWDLGLAVNLGGVINSIQAFLPAMRAQQQDAHIVNTSSLAAFVPMPANLIIYATAKAAVAALTESLRIELAQERIGVTLLCPGPVKSRIHELARNTRHLRSSEAFRRAARHLGEREVSPLWMDPLLVGRRVLEAILTDAPYVITHGEWRSGYCRAQ